MFTITENKHRYCFTSTHEPSLEWIKIWSKKSNDLLSTDLYGQCGCVAYLYHIFSPTSRTAILSWILLNEAIHYWRGTRTQSVFQKTWRSKDDIKVLLCLLFRNPHKFRTVYGDLNRSKTKRSLRVKFVLVLRVEILPIVNVVGIAENFFSYYCWWNGVLLCVLLRRVPRDNWLC